MGNMYRDSQNMLCHEIDSSCCCKQTQLMATQFPSSIACHYKNSTTHFTKFSWSHLCLPFYLRMKDITKLQLHTEIISYIRKISKDIGFSKRANDNRRVLDYTHNYLLRKISGRFIHRFCIWIAICKNWSIFYTCGGWQIIKDSTFHCL